MAKRVPQTRGPAVTTKIPIYTLSGGVSRQPQSKRLASEAQEMDNALVSLERSFEKRPGFEIVPQYKATNIWDNNPAISLSDDSKIDLFPLEHNYSTEKDYWFYWFNINDNNRFLVVIDYKATGSTDVLLYVFRIRPDGTWSNETQYSASNQQSSSIISATTRSYITYGSTTNKAKDVLKATTVGNSIIILNTLVKAGFTSGEVGWNGASTGGFTFNLDGSESTNTDNIGKAITYYSAARYAKGANSKWYLATGSTASCTVAGTANVGSSITITGMSFPVLQYNPGDTAATTRSTQTKIYVVQTATPANMIVCSGNDGSTGNNTWTVEKKYGSTISTSTGACTVYYGYYPEVEDFIWHDTTQPWLGQSLADFSEIRFPPELAEVNANNGLFLSSTTYDGTAKTMLDNLYPSDGNTDGNGKIYYTAAPYLNFTSGYYRIISSASKPYTKKVRSPDSYSVLDKTRMPQKITFNASAAGNTSDPKWFAAPIEWEPRTSGNRYSNPGPSVFLTDDKKKPRQVAIKAVSTFRDRLYFAAEDVIFTSQLGVYEDLFLADPSNIISTDPIDIRASSNTFSEITSMTPFNAYLFINTLGNVQYELKGSQNQITPLTAEISPTAFYSTAKFVEPQLMGSLIYFFDKAKLYLYLSSESTDLAIAQELTVTCADYLPNNYRGVCVAPSQNYIIITDDDKPNYTYLHASRFSGDRNLQNAFFRYVFKEEDNIMANQSYDDYLFSVFKRATTSKTGTAYFDNDPLTASIPPTTNNNRKYRYYLEKSYLRNQITSQPKLDRLFKIKLYDSNSDYDPATQQTVIRLPISYDYNTIQGLQIITDSSWSDDPDGNRVGEVVSPYAYTIGENYLEIVLNGRYVPSVKNIINPTTGEYVLSTDYTTTPKYLWIGLKFKMEVELSSAFVRDQNNNVIDGVLNLRTITTRHKKTGNYDIVVSNRGRTSSISTFTNHTVQNNQDILSLENYEEEGEFVANILGFSDNVSIKIVSEYPSPCNIVNMEIKGKFIQKYSALS